MSDLYRRCGCRRPNGSPFAPLPYPTPPDPADRSPRQQAQASAACPLLLEDRKHGTYGYSVAGGTDPGTGKRVQIRKSGFLTLKAAQQERAAVVQQLGAGTFKPRSNLTLAAFLEQWVHERTVLGLRPLKPSTARMYVNYIEQDIVPAIGRLRLDQVTKHDLQRFVNHLVEEGRGATTIRRIHAVLSSAMTTARKRDLTKLSPAADLDLPTPAKGRTKVWEPEQAGAFLDAAVHHRLGPLFELVMLTGLRRGEVTGLRWVDVDLTRREIVVRQQRVQLGGKVVEGTVKTEAGQERVIDLGGEAVGVLVAWRLQQDAERAAWGTAWQDGGYVFTRENGEPYRPAYVSRIFDTIVERLGLPHLPLHGLRHQHAALMIAAGADIALVSKRLGHSTIAVTSDLYGHLMRSAGRAAADAAEAVLPRRGDRVVHTALTRDAEVPTEEVVQTAERPGIP